MADDIVFDGFDWDEANLAHATRHGVSREEFEAAVTAGFTVRSAYERRGERRYSAIATSPAGKPIDIAFTLRNGRLRPITAHKLKRNRRREL